MWARVRWGRLAFVVLVGVVVGFYGGGWPLAWSTGLGFLIGGLAYELWFGPWLQARIDRRMDEAEREGRERRRREGR